MVGSAPNVFPGPVQVIPTLDAKADPPAETDQTITDFIAFTKATLGEAVADVRPSDRLTTANP